AVGQFQCQVSNRATVLVLRPQQLLPVAIKDAEDALNGIRDPVKHRLNHHRPEQFLVLFEDGQQQVFLGGKKVVQAAAAGLGGVENLRDASGGVAVLVKEPAGSFDQALASFRLHGGS